MLSSKKVFKFILNTSKQTGIPISTIKEKILYCLDIEKIPDKGHLHITYCQLEYIVHRYIL